MHTLICIVSYQAEDQIEQVLNRLPKEIWNSEAYHVLLSDDASSDSTVEKAKEAFQKLGTNYTIIKLHKNQGYGGNQKVCYRYAINNDYDNVVLLHGDCQYAPELVTKFPQYIKEKKAEVVLGSRMKDKAFALRGRMPWYKFCGNIILTWMQNRISKQKLSEYHTGYRAYSTNFLRSIPFEMNSDGFHFDTEIILQAFHANANIYEFSIPTFYGEEICRVPLFKYAIDVLSITVRYRMQQLGLMVSLKFPRSAQQIYVDKKNYPNSTHAVAFDYLIKEYSSKSVKVLDIGCGPGYLAKQLPPKIQYTGIDREKPVNSSFHSFIKMDLERDKWEIDICDYDCVLIMDVIEHLSDPEGFLIQLRNQMKKDRTTTILISTANVGFFLIRLNLLFGRFNYADRGILDITHKRLFTKGSFKNLLKETGYEIENLQGVGIPFRALGKGMLFRILNSISSLLARIYPSLFAFQFYGVVRPKLTTYQVINLKWKDPTAEHVQSSSKM